MKIFILFLIVLFCDNVFAQTNYYKVYKTFYENDYTYVDQIVKSTGKPIPLDDYTASFEKDDWTKDRCRTIVRRAFSSDERRRLQGYGLYVAMYISSETGRITEVNFDFVTFNPLATIPVSVYRQIETQLKENVWFAPTEYGRGLNYIYIGWKYYF